jgi:transcriptional regulator
MYLPTHFAEERIEALHDLIAQHPLGALVSHGPEGLDANHIPFELAPQVGVHGTLRAHVARNNPLWQELQDGAAVLVIFRAEQGYISPNWYPSKHETHQQVPTWNYRVVHVHGQLRIHDDERYVRALVARLTRAHEQRSGQAKPWKMGDSAPDYIDGLLRSIVGIEVDITQMVGKYKLSQNKALRDRQGMVEGLQANGQVALAEVARQTLPEANT